SNEGASSTEPLFKSLQELSQHTRELQESVMAIRAQPIKAVFSRFPRLVRELAMELSKDVHLELKGEGTEIDKTVIERLGEPLTHMIRNALDHGIETPEERIKAGKKAQGQILLNAEHRSGRIVIEISDDGKGIDRNRVLTKAKEQGIIKPDGVLPDEEIDQLIFHPGFSTAKEVTNISGRGVGMDVVKRSIQNLGGKINIQSKEGRGCIFTLTLPLTLAVMDGMIIACGEEFYVIPLIHIIETLRPTPIQVQPLIGNHDLLNIRGETIPLIYLFDVFSVKEAIQNPADSIVVVLETEGGEKYGLVVDEILGQQQVVLKSLESNYETIPGISAATILGNGHVALILDISTVKNLPPRHGIIFQTGLEQTCHKIAAAN
ncbi:MAG TPA: chemotaxis protein CheA, partial [Alphaproteobacteria bacterium]|nr:chemotaxis protein CheA [Alphaproteobacteria bacterium]